MQLDVARVLLACLTMSFSAPFAKTHLRILATSDVHMHLTGFDDSVENNVPRPGLARLAPLIRTARETAPGGCVLVDNGDALQGTPLAKEAFAGTWNAAHPFVKIMHALRYDAMGLGNHDFDFGEHYLETIIRLLDMPVLSGNTTGISGLRSHVILERVVTCDDGSRHPLRIGLTSALPTETGQWRRHVQSGQAGFSSALGGLTKARDALLEEGADLVLVLAHAGLEVAGAEGENFARQAIELDNVDAVIAGHTHVPFSSGSTSAGVMNALGFQKPCVQPGSGASSLGQIDLELHRDAHGDWHVAQANAQLIWPDLADAPDAGLLTQLADVRAAALARSSAIVATTQQRLHSYFAMLTANRVCGLVGQGMVDAIDKVGVPEGLSHLPRLAIVSHARTGGVLGPNHYLDIPEGQISARDLAHIHPFEDAMVVKVVSGAELMRHAERAAAIYCCLEAQDQPHLIDARMPGYQYDMIFGLTATMDPTAPPAFSPSGEDLGLGQSRVTSLDRDGVPVAADAQFLVAFTSYRAGGGGGYPICGTPVETSNPLPSIQSIVADSLSRTGPCSVPEIHLASAKTCQCVFDTSPKAEQLLDEIAAYAPKVIGTTPDGFLRLLLQF
jgi:2',3'-cyclic-nucleotide 2'-phosphodiesterase/3'-nucleotidase